MIATAALALGLFTGPTYPDVVKVERAGAWRVVRRTDRFTGAVNCDISRPKVMLRGALAVIDVGLGEAPLTVRLDSGPAFEIDAASGLDPVRVSPDVALNNPSGGELALPLDRIWRTHWVWVRAGAQSRPRRFDVSGAEQALAAARKSGCPGVASDLMPIRASGT